MKTRESTATLWVVRVVASRGLARETLGLWILSYVCKEVFLTAYHSPFPGVKAVSCFFFRKTLRVVLRRVFPCVGCSVVCGGVARDVHL
jgi:hypothetical protein